MPRRCTNCSNARRQQQHTAPTCQEAGTDPTMSRLCWLTTVGAYCGKSACKMMRGVTWIVGTLLSCVVGWMVYSELSGCVSSFFWNIVWTSLAIGACGVILTILSAGDIGGGDLSTKQEAISALITPGASRSKRSAYGPQGTSTEVVGQVDSLGSSRLTADGRSAGGGESAKRSTDDAEIRVTDLSSSDDINVCDPCPLAEEDTSAETP